MRPFSVKAQLIIFLSLFAVYLAFADKDPLFLPMALVAVAGAATADSLAVFLKQKKFVLTQSSVISGLIIGHVVSSAQPWWKFFCISLLAVGSKHLIRPKGRHLFNPAAFGIFLAVVFLGAATQWRGAGLWYILLAAGSYFLCKTDKWEIAAAYLFCSLVLFGAHALIQNLPLADVLRYQNYFFIFVMLIEPKTTPLGRRGKIIFGSAVAVLVFILTLRGVPWEAELAGLLFMNLFVPVLNHKRP